MGQLPDGVMIVGRLESKRDGDFCRMTVLCDYVDSDGKPNSRARQIEYRGYSAVTGKATRVSEALQALNEGDRVCVVVFVKAQPGGTSNRTGKTYGPFTTFDAVDVQLVSKASALKPVPAAS